MPDLSNYVLLNKLLMGSMVFFLFSLMGYEGLEVVNPEGGTEDAEAEAQRGRWRQEVHFSLLTSFLSFLI